jgi:transcription termination factor NusB
VSNPSSDDPLVEWNRLNKENAEHGFVSALYQSMTETSPLVDKFSLWLLAGTGATGTLLITQIKSVLPFLTQQGFKVCLVILVTSAVIGFVAKYFSLRCEIQSNVQSKFTELVKPVLDKHEKDEDTIQEYAEQRGIELQTDIDLASIMKEFSRPFPFWVKWLISRKIDKTSGDRQAGFHIAVKAYTSQLRWTLLQAVLFLVFMLTAAWYANAI